MLKEELDAFFKQVVRDSKKNLKANGAIASKDLYNSLKYQVKESKNSFEASLFMEDYGTFINYGVKGTKSGKSLKGYKYTNKKPPLRFLRTWLKQKSGRFRSRDLTSQAFRVQNIVYQRGIKPTEFYSKPFEKAFRSLPDELIEAYGLELDDFLNFVFNGE